MSPSLCIQVWHFLLWCQDNTITVPVKHLPGRSNVLADLLSRTSKPLLAEWSLSASVLQQIFHHVGTPMVDLFATRHNHRLPLYVSPVLDPAAWAVDALSLNWGKTSGICVSPVHPSSSGFNQDQGDVCVPHSSYSPAVASESVVPITAGSSCRPSDPSPVAPRPSVSTVRSVRSSEPRNAPPSRLDLVKRGIREARFSRAVAS